MRLTQLGYLACGVLVLGLWLPWGKLKIGLLGSDPSGLGTINGQEIGSDVLSLPVGWIAAGAAIVAGIGLFRWSRGQVIASAAVALLDTVTRSSRFPVKRSR